MIMQFLYSTDELFESEFKNRFDEIVRFIKLWFRLCNHSNIQFNVND